MAEADVYVMNDTGLFKPVGRVNPVPVEVVTPEPLTSANLSGTIKESNEFQSVQVINPARRGGMIQNQKHNSNPMWVFVGPIEEAEKSRSYYMQSGDPPFSCLMGIAVITDEISITGTAGDAYFTIFQ